MPGRVSFYSPSLDKEGLGEFDLSHHQTKTPLFRVLSGVFVFFIPILTPPFFI
jgi:hypothetical protein